MRFLLQTIIIARLGVVPNQARLRWKMIFDASRAIAANPCCIIAASINYEYTTIEGLGR
jgi:hypothetical protein